MNILAGVDKQFDGEFHLDDGIKVGYLQQEPSLSDGETVMENVMAGVAGIQADLDEFARISQEMAEPDCNMDALMERMGQLQEKLDACNAWELERTVVGRLVRSCSETVPFHDPEQTFPFHDLDYE